MRKTSWRWAMLAMACLFLVGSYYCYDIPGVIEKQIEERFNKTPTQWSLLYTVYSFPNMALPIFGGIFLDKIGMRVGLLLFTTILTLGQAVFWIGGQNMSWYTMIAGRFIFGLGGECMSVA
mmetsp:Transcript_30180/g.46140  ORF Transcript_30180/g.46140 Transcript_30180/m.46140 type:complete len:121 (+) Transcript_30180:104-466(+)